MKPLAVLARGTLAAAALSLLAAAAHGEPLRVCFNDHDAPRADKASGDGFDIELMGLVGQRIGRPLEIVWIASDPKMTDVDDFDLPLKPLAKGQCDAVASVPGEMALLRSHGALALTRPYYGAAFELVGPNSLPDDLAALKGRKVSVQNVSVANLAAVSLGLDWTAQTTSQAQPPRSTPARRTRRSSGARTSARSGASRSLASPRPWPCAGTSTWRRARATRRCAPPSTRPWPTLTPAAR